MARLQQSAGGRPRVPAGRRVYAIGDIHGRSDLLRRMRRRVVEDAGAGAPAANVLVHLGDYVDRGPGSFEVVDLLLHQPLPGFEAVHLKGNHEDLLLRYLDDERVGPTWFSNGGIATLESYGLDVFADGDDAVPPEMVWSRFRRLLPADHRAFLSGLALSHREGDYLFVHAGVRPGVALDAQRESDLLWIRDEFLASGGDFGAVVVHGHSIAAEPETRANRIGIDTGAYYSGRLTCLVLEGEERRFLHT